MSEVKKVPEIRFAGFSDSWEQRKLGDFGCVSMCKRIFKEQTAEKGDVPFYKIGTFGGEPDAFIPHSLFEEYRTKYPYPEPGAILISASGSIGRTVEFSGEDEYFQDSNIVWLNHDNRLNNSFLKQLYTIIRWSGIEGSTIKRLYNDNILKTEIMLPCVAEQLKIGQFFHSLDNLLTIHQRKHEKLVALKKAMLEKMFPQKGNTTPEVRFAGFTGPWEQRKLGDILRTLSFKLYLKAPEQDGKFEIIQQGNDPIIGFANGEPCDDFKNTVIFGDHTLSLFKPKRPFFVATDGVRILQGINGMDGNYLLSLLERNRPKSEGYKRYYSILADREIFFTDNSDEQTQIGSYFRQLDNIITLHQRKHESLKHIKAALLQKMFV